MGIEAFSLRMLCEARRRGAQFSRTATLGRQNLSLLPVELERISRSMGRTAPPRRHGDSTWGVAADAVLTDLLGIDHLVAIDYSGYEGAAIVHDMNHPIPSVHHQAYDAVIDGGTLEHVFNFPVAIASCMNMLKVNGRFFALTPANNHCGHGFYQFSPELYFRLFSGANGFQIEHVLAVEHPFPGIELSTSRNVFSVRDPADVGTRVGLVNSRPVYLFVQAVKREHVEPFSPYPQQSDYQASWSKSAAAPGMPPARRPLVWRLHQALPLVWRRTLFGCVQRWHWDTLRNRKRFRHWDHSGTVRDA